MNQAAGVGAMALKGNMELTRCSFGPGDFNYDEPQFFFLLQWIINWPVSTFTLLRTDITVSMWRDFRNVF